MDSLSTSWRPHTPPDSPPKSPSDLKSHQPTAITTPAEGETEKKTDAIVQLRARATAAELSRQSDVLAVAGVASAAHQQRRAALEVLRELGPLLIAKMENQKPAHPELLRLKISMRRFFAPAVIAKLQEAAAAAEARAVTRSAVTPPGSDVSATQSADKPATAADTTSSRSTRPAQSMSARRAAAAVTLQAAFRRHRVRELIRGVSLLRANGVVPADGLGSVLDMVVALDNRETRYSTVRKSIEKMVASNTTATVAAEKARVAAVRASAAHEVFDRSATKALASTMAMTPDLICEYCYLEATLETIVGLDEVKRWCRKELADVVQRHVKGGDPKGYLRHIMLRGTLGAGKRTAAGMIARLYRLVTRLRANSQSGGGRGNYPATLPARGHEKDEELVLAEPNGAKQFGLYITHPAQMRELKQPQPSSTYFVQLSKSAFAVADGKWLAKLQAAGSVAILAGSASQVDKYDQLPEFRRRVPHSLVCPSLTAPVLSKLIVHEAQARGYTISTSPDRVTPAPLSRVVQIVELKFDDAVIAARNAYLAADMIEAAISNKNDRMAKAGQHGQQTLRALASTAVLSHHDFEVEIAGRAELEARQATIQAEVDAAVGWGGPEVSYGEDDTGSEVMSPKKFFQRTAMAFAADDGAADDLAPGPRLSWPGNMWVTGNTGTGKTKFAALAIRYLRAFGALRSDHVVIKNGMELRSGGDPGQLLKAWFTEADGGALFIDEAYSILGSDVEQHDDVSGRSAVQMLLTEVESKRDSVLVVLAGYKDRMRAFMATDPGLPGRFLRHVHCEDYTAAELTEMVVRVLADRGCLLGEPELGEPAVRYQLERWINDQYLDGTGADTTNGRLARNIAESAIVKAQNRAEKNRAAVERAGKPTPTSPSVLIPPDFGIGIELGGGAAKRAEVAAEIEALIGMDVAKKWFQKFRAKIEYVEKTQDRSALKTCLNLVITGNPGTGKTTFTRLVFKVLHTYGILPRDNFIEKNGLELKGRYVGETAPKVRKAVREAMGGCLFLDEAYALSEGGSGGGGGGLESADPYAQEAVRTLLTEIENNRTNLMVVFAGYKDKIGHLMRLDPGLDRRFPERLHLDDYTAAELADIAEHVARDRFGKKLASGVRDMLADHILHYYKKEIAAQNGGLAVNLTEKAVDRQLQRIVANAAFSSMDPDAARAAAAVLTAEDFGVQDKRTLGDNDQKAALRVELDGLVGMANVKTYLAELAEVVEYVEKGGDPAVLSTNLNLVLTGNPGTGKTTVARLIAKFLHVHGMLPKSNFVEKNGLELKGRYVGHTSPQVKEAIANAMGGCLFLDEAYALAQGGDSFSGEAVRTLLTECENNRTNLMVVLAGYEAPMADLMRMDPGLPRRFATTLHLDDYSAPELAEICEYTAQTRFKLSFAPGLRGLLAATIATKHAHQIETQNAGLSVNLVEKAVRRLASRAAKASVGRGYAINLKELVAADFGIDPDATPPPPRPPHPSLSGYTHRAPPSPIGGRGECGHKRCDCGRLHNSQSGKEPVEYLYQDALPKVEDARDSPAEEETDEVTEVPTEDVDAEEPDAVESELSDEAEPELSDEDDTVNVQERLRAVGKCPQNYDWNDYTQQDKPCGLCGKLFWHGWRCSGGSHYVCYNCLAD